ncbi:MAG TPA: L-threonylcarbamoyladenylate synthase [Clostridia bacterium]|nr:L-threonylcarbamoyladenylate synthase [Clostridia bacterium]
MKKKHTKYIKINTDSINRSYICEAAEILRTGGLVAFPTETVYGLGANALDGKAVSTIFSAKGRPQDNPLIVHLARGEDVQALIAGDLPRQAKQLMEAFWPGPLTLVLPKGKAVPDEVSAGLDTVAVRVPAHPVALALIEEAGLPVAAPSANLSGRPSPTTAEHVYMDLNGRIDVILDGGPTNVGVESTVLDLTAAVPVILRPGGVMIEELKPLLGDVEMGSATSQSPAQKYKHYSPKVPMVLVEGERENVVAEIHRLVLGNREKGQTVGILAPSESAQFYRDLAMEGDPDGAVRLITLGSRNDLQAMASSLFTRLRLFDDLQADVVYIEGVEPEGAGLAIMDRLRHAAIRCITV